MRPSLSPFEYGAYGIPPSVESFVSGGAHAGSVGRAESRFRNVVDAMLGGLFSSMTGCEPISSYG